VPDGRRLDRPGFRVIAERTPAGRSLLLPGIVVLVAAGTLVTGMLTPRDLSMGEDAVEVSSGGALAVGLSRLFTGGLLFLSLAGAATAVIRGGFPRAGLAIWLSYLLFVVLDLVLPGIAGLVPGLDARVLFTPLVFTAVYLAQPMPAGRLVAICKGALLAFVYASLLGLVVAPAQVLATGYVGVIPGLDVRLYGVAGGSTSLGTQAAAFLALEVVTPSQSRWRRLHLAAAAVTLLLTQNKTSWLFVACGAALLAWRRVSRRKQEAGPPAVWPARLARRLALGMVALLLVAVVVALASGLGEGPGDDAANLRNLTGRTYIWAISMQTWLENPMLGYGLGLWEGEAFRARHGHFAHAHNQFLQAMASAGLVGLLGLLVYLRSAWVASRGGGAGAAPRALLLLLVWIALTDVPLHGRHLLDAFALLHLILFALLVGAERSAEG
jgi:O-antigen ligase